MAHTNVTARMPLKPHNVRQLEARSRSRTMKVRVFVVEPEKHYFTRSQSSDGDIYQITRDRDGWHCDCKGFFYTNICKHVAQVERRSEREGWDFGKIARN